VHSARVVEVEANKAFVIEVNRSNREVRVAAELVVVVDGLYVH
jgi:hypothetical protein